MNPREQQLTNVMSEMLAKVTEKYIFELPEELALAAPQDAPQKSEVTQEVAAILNSKISKCEVIDHKLPTPTTAAFQFSAKDYFEFRLMVYGFTLFLQRTKEAFPSSPMSISVDVNKQFNAVLEGHGIYTSGDGKQVLAHSIFNKDNGILFISFGSHSQAALEEAVNLWQMLCMENNCFRGKHLKLHHPQRDSSVEFLPTPSMPTIYGFEDAQKSLEINALKFFKASTLHNEGILRRGVLLHGPPGTGKTLLVNKTKRCCLEQGITVVDLDTTAMHYVEDWYSSVEKWLSPALVVLEDFDLISSDRTVSEGKAVTNDLLASLSVMPISKAPVVTLATTNRLLSLDHAVIRSRRMDKLYEIKGLQKEFKLKLFEKKGLPATDELREIVEGLGEDTTGADVEDIAISSRLLMENGYSDKDALQKAYEEWETSHRMKKGTLGFGAG